MEVIAQKLEDIIASLRPLTIDWRDETACRVIERLHVLPIKEAYTAEDVRVLLDEDFKDGILICRLFLGLSDDSFTSVFGEIREKGQAGVKGYRADRAAFIEDLLSMGLLEALNEEVNRKPHWSDVLVERLRSGRGSAISGQKRGRGVEDFVEAIVKKVFGKNFEVRCSFEGLHRTAKCDFAIPSKNAARILIEAKGYGATGSKMSDVINDLETISNTKRPDTTLLFFTDGLPWKRRQSDLKQIVERQNNGYITRIYTLAMVEQFEADLRQLKAEYKL